MRYNYKYDDSADSGLEVNQAGWIPKDIIINGNGHTLDGSSYTYAVFFTGVYGFNDVVFKKFDEIVVGNSVNFIRCNLTGGGVIYSAGYVMKVINCNFFNVTNGRFMISNSNPDSIVENCSFKNLNIQTYIISQLYKIKNCSFEDITCPNHMPMFDMPSNDNIFQSIEDCIFIKCSAKFLIEKYVRYQNINSYVFINNCIFLSKKN